MNAPAPTSPPRRRGLLLTIAAGAFLFLIVAPAVAAWFAFSDDIDQSKAEIVAAREALALKPRLEEELRGLRRRAQTAPGLLDGTTAALAQAQLATQMKTIIEANHGVLMSAQMLQPTKRDSFDQVAIEYDMTIPFSRLKNFLYAVEAHAPYFYFDEADIRTPANWHPVTDAAPDPTIEIHCTVHAYHWSARA